jgi:hypothetical protein
MCIAGGLWVVSREKAKALAKEYGLIAVEYPVQERWIFVRMEGELPIVIATATHLEVDMMPERIICDRLVKGLMEEMWDG